MASSSVAHGVVCAPSEKNPFFSGPYASTLHRGQEREREQEREAPKRLDSWGSG